MAITDRLKMDEFDYENLPKCHGCPLMGEGDERTRCALYWRPGTGTKRGFPTEDGWECPRSDEAKLKDIPIEAQKQRANSYLDLFLQK